MMTAAERDAFVREFRRQAEAQRELARKIVAHPEVFSDPVIRSLHEIILVELAERADKAANDLEVAE